MRWTPFIFFLVVLAAAVWRLDHPVLWNDEADTAFLARSIAQAGVPLAWDGRNAMIFKNCSQLSQSLVSRKIPWAQYYVAYLSSRIFGDSTGGFRALFALIGILSFWPLGLLLKGRVKYPWLLAAVLLLLPQNILFIRNCRYFSLLIFASIALIWALLSSEKKIVLALLSVLLFFTHPLSAALTLFGASVFVLWKRRASDLPWLWVGAPLWAAWYFSSRGFPENESSFLSLLWQNPHAWWLQFQAGFAATFTDLDYVGVAPMLFWGILLAIGFHLRKIREMFADPLIGLSLCVSVALAFGTLVIAGVETNRSFTILRYMPQACVLLPMTVVLLVSRLGTAKRPGLIMAIVLFTNLVSLGLWTEHQPMTWWLPVYRQIFFETTDTLKDSFEALQKMDPKLLEAPVEVLPDYMKADFLVYLGDKIVVAPKISKPECAEAVASRIGQDRMQALQEKPKLDVLLVPLDDAPSRGKWLPFPTYQFLPDSSRPELTRHEFANHQPVSKYGILVLEP
jgi:hypothetical protein